MTAGTYAVRPTDEERVVPQRPYDVVLLGATGFTGRLVAEHLVRHGDGVRLAIAGRSREKLEAVAEDLARLPGGAATAPGILTADTNNLVSLLDVAAQTRVLFSTVGPYARHGELVVQACVREGTDYADITGEPEFVKLVQRRYGADAARRGVRLVSCCGFDSVPHDLGVQYTVEQLADAGAREVPISVRGFVSAKGAASGGTWASALEAIGGAGLSDIFGGGSGRDRAEDDPERRVRAARGGLRRVPEIGGYAVPLPTIDPQIVLRSARALDAYGPDFSYGHYLRVASPVTLAAGGLGLGLLLPLAQLGPTRGLLKRLLPSGSGPDEAQREAGWFRVEFLARAGGTRLRTRVSGDGDPGYAETSKMAAQAALALALDDLPDAAGAVTPAQALGKPYRARLQQQGMRFEVVND